MLQERAAQEQRELIATIKLQAALRLLLLLLRHQRSSAPLGAAQLPI